MQQIGRYINSIREFNLKRKELAAALDSDLFRFYFLKGKPSKDGKNRGYYPSSCIHPKSDEVITDHIARKLIINALKKYDAIESNEKWSPNWQRKTKTDENDVFTYVYRHKSNETKKNIFIKIQVETDCNLHLLTKGKTRINKCIGFHPSGQN